MNKNVPDSNGSESTLQATTVTEFGQSSRARARLRIVLINQYYAPDEAATAQMLCDLGAMFASAGHDVEAICCDRAYTDPSRRYSKRETIDGVRVHRLPSPGFGRGTMIGRALDYASFFINTAVVICRSPRPDLILSLTTPPFIALLGATIGSARGAKAVMWSMDVYPDIAYELGKIRMGSLVGRLLDRLSRMTLRRQDLVIALGGTMAKRLSQAGARRVEVIHNWSDGEAIRPIAVTESSIRAEFGWGDRFVILYSGNLGMAHEFDTVLRAAELLRADRRVLFAFLGAGPQLNYVLRRTVEMSLENVEMRPPVSRDRLGDSLAAGDVHLVTLRPGMPGLLVPSKIYGVLAAGRPTLYVGPHEGEVHDIVTAGCGLSIRNDDSKELVAAVRRYVENPTLRTQHGIAARALFDANFSKNRAMLQFEDSLTDIVRYV